MVTTPNRPDHLDTPEYVPPTYTPPPPVKKSSKGRWILAAVVGLFVLGLVAAQNDTQGTGTTSRYSSSAPAITSHDILESQLDANPAAVAQFCDGYTNLKAIGLSDSEILSTLDAGGAFDALEGTDISSYELFTAMAGRC